MTEEVQNAIKDSALLVVETMGFPLNSDGVEGIDAFIERLREKYSESDEDFKNGIVFRLGSFLGEAIIVNFGGEWIEDEGHYAISFDSDSSKNNIAYVFSKIMKRFEDIEDDKILSFYNSIGEVMGGDLLKKDI